MASGELRRLRDFARPITGSPGPPLPPPLPPGRTVDVPGRGEMFVRDLPGPPGGPTILLLHGWTASADLNWFLQYGPLARIGRVIAVDHRGHGRGIRSAEPFTLEDCADDAAGLLRVLGVGSAIVCGYSMGGPIAALLWKRHPELVAGLVFEATALEWRATRRERIVWRLMKYLEFLLRFNERGTLERVLRDAIDRAPEARPYAGWLNGEARRGDRWAIAEAGGALGRYDARPWAARIAVPTAVVVTTADRLVRPRKQRALARAVPGATVHELAADHDAPIVAAAAFTTATVAAVRDVAGRAGLLTEPGRLRAEPPGRSA